MTRSDISSDSDVSVIKSKNKENKVPNNLSLVMSKSNHKSKKLITNNNKKVIQPEEEEEEEEEEVEESAEEDEDEIMEEAAPIVKKNSTKKSNKATTGGGGKKEVEDGEEKVKMSGMEKRLRAKLDAKTEGLKIAHEAFTKLKELRFTSPEQQLKTLTDLAAERQAAAFSTIQNYKSENDSLRTQLLSLNTVPNPNTVSSKTLSNQASSPAKASKSEDQIRVEQLLVANNVLQVELNSLREKSERNERKKLEERDSKWEKELEKISRSKDEEIKETKTSLSMATQELEAEIQHSKSLQAKLKLSSNNPQPLLRHGSGEEGAYKKLQEEHEDLKARLHLNEDCTGLMVNSFKRDASGDTYSCVMSDLLQKTGSLAFNLTFNKDQSISYAPQIEEDRDAAIIAILPKAFSKFMRFDSSLTGSWFRELFKGLNNLKVE